MCFWLHSDKLAAPLHNKSKGHAVSGHCQNGVSPRRNRHSLGVSCSIRPKRKERLFLVENCASGYACRVVSIRKIDRGLALCHSNLAQCHYSKHISSDDSLVATYCYFGKIMGIGQKRKQWQQTIVAVCKRGVTHAQIGLWISTIGTINDTCWFHVSSLCRKQSRQYYAQVANGTMVGSAVVVRVLGRHYLDHRRRICLFGVLRGSCNLLSMHRSGSEGNWITTWAMHRYLSYYWVLSNHSFLEKSQDPSYCIPVGQYDSATVGKTVLYDSKQLSKQLAIIYRQVCLLSRLAFLITVTVSKTSSSSSSTDGACFWHLPSHYCSQNENPDWTVSEKFQNKERSHNPTSQTTNHQSTNQPTNQPIQLTNNSHHGTNALL